MNGIGGWKKNPFWIRLFHWEYWSFNTVYLPIYPVFIFLCIRARSFFFFAASNPKIKNGGFLGESKKDICAMVPADLQPRTIFFPGGTSAVEVMKQITEAGFHFPLIGKPDIGARGRGIKKLENDQSLLLYVSSLNFDFHIQEFISYEKEAGIFYYRFPGEEHGCISGIVRKEFLKVRGDGQNKIRELLKQNPRAVLQLAQLEIQEPEMLDRILEHGELYTVSPYGNHARGALFLDDSVSVNPELIQMMDTICRRIPEFYFGRLDIRFESWQKLRQGKAFSIIEVNGAGSEPTHIYDPRHSIFFAWKEIIRHWIILFKVSRANHKRGYPYLSFSEGLRMFQKDKTDSKILSDMQNKF